MPPRPRRPPMPRRRRRPRDRAGLRRPTHRPRTRWSIDDPDRPAPGRGRGRGPLPGQKPLERQGLWQHRRSSGRGSPRPQILVSSPPPVENDSKRGPTLLIGRSDHSREPSSREEPPLKYQILYQPSFSLAVVSLERNEQVMAES